MEFDEWIADFVAVVRGKGRVQPGKYRAYGYKRPGHRWNDLKLKWREVRMKRGKAPKGSGVPVGTEYHWYILAHQNVRKYNANIYTTAMTGLKYKLAHKRADSDKWSASDKAQRRRLVKLLLDMIAQLEMEPIIEEQTMHANGRAHVNGKSHKTKAITKKKKAKVR